MSGAEKEPDLKWLMQNARSILVRNLLPTTGLRLPHLLPSIALEVTTTADQRLFRSNVEMESCNPSWAFSGLVANECVVDNMEVKKILVKVVSEDDGQALITELFDLAKLIPLPRALTVKGGAQQGLSINFIAIDVDDSLFISESTFSAVMGDSVTFTGSYLEIEDDSRDTDASNRSVTLSKSISQSNIKIEELRKALDSKWADIRMTKMAIERENSLSQLEELKRELAAAEVELHAEEQGVAAERAALAQVGPLQSLMQQCRQVAADKAEAEALLGEKKKDLLKVKFLAEARQVKLLSELQTMYPIERLDSSSSAGNGGTGTTARGSGEYAIRGLELPADLNSVKDDEHVSAALGYVVHLTLLASKYLEVPLRYQMLFMGSRSFIRDPVLGATGGTLPLFRRNVEKERFDRAVAWLRRDVEQLLQTRGVLYEHGRDSNILYNLHQLFFCEMCPRLAL